LNTYLKILIILILLLLLIKYLLDFIDFKNFCKKNYEIDINFFVFTHQLINKKIREIF